MVVIPHCIIFTYTHFDRPVYRLHWYRCQYGSTLSRSTNGSPEYRFCHCTTGRDTLPRRGWWTRQGRA